jgi:site-specific DNA recombinase
VRRKKSGNRAAGYVRVSDESQVDGHSLDAQRSEIARWCERTGYQLVAIYADEGVSAYSKSIEKRPQLMQLLNDADAGTFDIAVVHTLDRWSRRSAVMSQSLERLERRVSDSLRSPSRSTTRPCPARWS